MKKTTFTLALMLVVFTANAQSNLEGDMNHDGEKNITDVMLLVDEILNGSKPQAYLTCPDGNHPHLIDLGLPSGTKWACCNVGADKPEAYGGYYAWGETEVKSSYNWGTYIHCDGSEATCHNLGEDIARTKYDVAHVKWGGSWVMPSNNQQQELLDNCTSTWTTQNDVPGRLFIGKNGGRIFLPAAGRRWNDRVISGGINGFYWSSTNDPTISQSPCLISFGSGGAEMSSTYYRGGGLSVRPVLR